MRCTHRWRWRWQLRQRTCEEPPIGMLSPCHSHRLCNPTPWQPAAPQLRLHDMQLMQLIQLTPVAAGRCRTLIVPPIHVNPAGFSEYASYASWVRTHHPESQRLTRKKTWLRYGLGGEAAIRFVRRLSPSGLCCPPRTVLLWTRLLGCARRRPQLLRDTAWPVLQSS